MTRYSARGHRIDADYTEDLVGFALESFLTSISFPRHRFSIEPFSRAKERWLGADARLHGEIKGFRPFYMQFKRPSAYPDYSMSKVIVNRKSLKLRVSPRSLYFSLRDKREKHRDFQHNVLLRLHQRLRSRGIGDAAYVCPLFLDRSAYRFHLHWSGIAHWLRFWRYRPWELEDVLLNNGSGTVRFDRIPVLTEHVSIPPHDKVSTAKHRYSFTEEGTDLCFHSPEAVPDGAVTLAKFLMSISDGFLDRGEKIQPQTANEELRYLIEAVEAEPPEGLPAEFETARDDPIGNWLAWGDYLRLEHGIDQYALVTWKEWPSG